MGKVKKTITEFVLVGAICTAFGFAANLANSFGLSLSRNYILSGDDLPDPGQKQTATAPVGDPDNVQAQPEYTMKGFQIIKHEGVVALLKDPMYDEGFKVIIDARKVEYYLEGHIQGAHHLDPYRYSESQLEEVLDICRAAGEIVVYCDGGDCEDSPYMYMPRVLITGWKAVCPYAKLKGAAMI